MSAQLERIIAEGTSDSRYSKRGKPSNHIQCADGFQLSVIAGGGAYCSPRLEYGTEATGPFSEVEVGFPSERPEPWAEWVEYCESPDMPTDTVYAFVPVDLVRALVESHGGAA